MNKPSILFVLALILYGILVWSGCNNDDDGEVVEPMSMNNDTIVDDTIPEDTVRYTFEGITLTDLMGVIISNDPTDWRLDDQWEEWEEALFPEGSAILCDSSASYRFSVFPNPAQGQFMLSMDEVPGKRVSLRLVDEFLTPLISIDSSDMMIMGLMAPPGIKDTVRLYYKVFEDGCEVRGHGDILLQ